MTRLDAALLLAVAMALALGVWWVTGMADGW